MSSFSNATLSSSSPSTASSDSHTSTPSTSSPTTSSDPSTSSTPISTSTVIHSSSTTVITTTASSTPQVTTKFETTTVAGKVTPSVVIHTVTQTPSNTPSPSSKLSSSKISSVASTSSAASLQSNGQKSGSSGLSPSGTIAIAVVVPVVVVALLLFLILFCWKRRKQKKNSQEAIRKEVEEYGYNPNHDPTLPAVAAVASHDTPQMAEDTSGYRGWSNNTNGAFSNRKTSTTMSGGGAGLASDGTPGSPGLNGNGNGMRGGGYDANGVGVVAAGLGRHTSNSRSPPATGGVHRGPSNASSSYSAANHTDGSDEVPVGQHEQAYDNNYSQYTPYQPGAAGYTGEPVIRDVSARRNTKIEKPSVYPQQGNSGIAQNF